MAFDFNAAAKLGASRSGEPIGYRLVDIDEVVTAAFTTTDVIETGVAGNFYVQGGISLPTGWMGRIVWGISGTDYAEEFITSGQVSDPGEGVSGPFSGCE